MNGRASLICRRAHHVSRDVRVHGEALFENATLGMVFMGSANTESAVGQTLERAD